MYSSSTKWYILSFLVFDVFHKTIWHIYPKRKVQNCHPRMFSSRRNPDIFKTNNLRKVNKFCRCGQLLTPLSQTCGGSHPRTATSHVLFKFHNILVLSERPIYRYLSALKPKWRSCDLFVQQKQRILFRTLIIAMMVIRKRLTGWLFFSVIQGGIFMRYILFNVISLALLPWKLQIWKPSIIHIKSWPGSWQNPKLDRTAHCHIDKQESINADTTSCTIVYYETDVPSYT